MWHTTTGRVIPGGALDVERAGVLFQPGIWEFESSKVSPAVRLSDMTSPEGEKGPPTAGFPLAGAWPGFATAGPWKTWSTGYPQWVL